jgi:dipeptidyl aminopeptidase/acylaminoacyl peptidase
MSPRSRSTVVPRLHSLTLFALSGLATLALATAQPATSFGAPAATPGRKPAKPSGPPAFSLEHALTLRTIAGITWSPDGRRVAFVVNAPDTAENTTNQDLWLWDATTNSCRALTRHPKNDYSPTFSPGGDTLAFVSPRDSEEGKTSIWLLPLRGGEPWKLATFVESVGDIRWSPDGQRIAYTMLDTLSKQVKDWKKKKWDQVVEDEIPQYNHLWTIDVASGRQTRITSGKFMVSEPRWSPDSRAIAFRWNPTGAVDDGNLTDIAIVSAAAPGPGGATLRKLDAQPDGGFAWSPDGRWLAWAGTSDRSKHVEKTDLWVAPAAGGRAIKLTGAFDEDASSPAWSPDSDTLYFSSQQGASTRIAAVPRAGGSVALGADVHGELGAAPVAGPDHRVAYALSRSNEPLELAVADHPQAPPRTASQVNAAAAPCAFGATRTVRWTSTDGVRVEGVLVRPVGAPERSALKTLVLLHGGPYQSRYGLGFNAMAQFMAAHGYQVFLPNFRSSGGYGTTFMLRQRSDWGGQDWRDVETGVDSLVKWGLADGSRLGVFGHSYGGYLSAWAITHTTRYDAAVVSAGAPDLAALWAQSDTHQYRAFEFEGFPWASYDKWRRSSPIAFIDRAKTPTLVLNGEADVRIPYPQAQETYQSLKFLGVPAEFVHYPREGHGLREPRHRADWYARQLAWFDRWVK